MLQLFNDVILPKATFQLKCLFYVFCPKVKTLAKMPKPNTYFMMHFINEVTPTNSIDPEQQNLACTSSDKVWCLFNSPTQDSAACSELASALCGYAPQKIIYQ